MKYLLFFFIAIVLISCNDDDSNINSSNGEGIERVSYDEPYLISFSIAESTFVNLSIYSMSPLQLKKTLIDEPLYTGNYQILWGYTDDNGDTVSTGYYKTVLSASGQTKTKLFYLK
jgi:hypothetical protein